MGAVPIVPHYFGGLKQEVHKFQFSLGYKVKPRLKRKGFFFFNVFLWLAFIIFTVGQYSFDLPAYHMTSNAVLSPIGKFYI